jgi:hypothetical protein
MLRLLVPMSTTERVSCPAEPDLPSVTPPGRYGTGRTSHPRKAASP